MACYKNWIEKERRQSDVLVEGRCGSVLDSDIMLVGLSIMRGI